MAGAQVKAVDRMLAQLKDKGVVALADYRELQQVYFMLAPIKGLDVSTSSLPRRLQIDKCTLLSLRYMV